MSTNNEATEVTPMIQDDWGAHDSDSFEYQVDAGLKGMNEGISNGLTKLNRWIHGTHQAKYYLIGADSGVGKTTFTDFAFIFSAYEDCKRTGRPFDVIYYSLEISKAEKKAKWVCHYIFINHGITLSTDYILGRIKGKKLSAEHLILVREATIAVNALFKHIIFIEDTPHPTKVFEDVIAQYYEKKGTVRRAKISEEDQKKGKKGRVMGYSANNPWTMTMLVIDHLALLHSEMGLNMKQTIDKMSRYGVIFKNLFRTTVVFVQQFSTDLLSAKREAVRMKGKGGAFDITPNRLDFGDSKATFRDADVVFGLMKPRDFSLEEYANWVCTSPAPGKPGLGVYLVVGFLMKNRGGPDNKRFEFFVNHGAGIFYDLPSELGKEEEWYDEALKLAQEWLLYSPPEE